MARKFESYRLSRLAEADLANIYAYTVKHWSVHQADSDIITIQTAINGLVEGVKHGRSRSELGTTYLSCNVGSHLIFYRETKHILVVRILHASMDLPRHLATL